MTKGIYVLITSDGCRVAPLLSYDKLFTGYHPESMKKYLDANEVQNSFGNCKVLPEKSAIEFAQTIAKNYNCLEDGIRVMTDYRNFTFEDILNGKASKNQ